MRKCFVLFFSFCLCLLFVSCVSDKEKSLEANPETEEVSTQKEIDRSEIIKRIEENSSSADLIVPEENKEETVSKDVQKVREESAALLELPLPKVKNSQQIADFIEKNYSEDSVIPYEAFVSSLELPDRELLPFGALVLESYRLAYPDKDMKVFEKEGDWCIELEGMIFAWADGRLLPFKKRVEADKYGRQIIYPYTGKPRNPKEYTPEDIAELKKKGTKAALAAELPVDISFTQFLLQSNDRIATERNIRSMTFLGHRLNVHKMIVPFVEKIDKEIKEAAKTDKKVASFITEITEVGGYNWRTIDGTNGRRSYHSYGMAIDMTSKNSNKPTYWEWVRTWNSKWMLVPQSSLWLPPEQVIKIFEKYGFVWGGTWDEYDTMHFEFRPELSVLSYFYLMDEE